MIIALGTHLVVAINFFAIDDFSAMIALEPHAFAPLGTRRRRRVRCLFFFKPGHEPSIGTAVAISRQSRRRIAQPINRRTFKPSCRGTQSLSAIKISFASIPRPTQRLARLAQPWSARNTRRLILKENT